MLALPLPPRVYSITDFILFITLITSLLAAFMPLHSTTFDTGLDGLGKIDSRLKYFRIRQYSYLCVLRIKCHMAQFCSKLSYNLWTKIFKDKIFEESKKTLKYLKIGALEIFWLCSIIRKLVAYIDNCNLVHIMF